MADKDNLMAEISETEKKLKDLKAQMKSEDSEQMRESPDEEKSFANMVEERMSPAEEVADTPAAPMVEGVMVGLKMADSSDQQDQINMNDLYSTVYDSAYDSNNPKDQEQMQSIKDALQDPRVMAMARKDPDKFALFMYGRASAMT